jgi:hypothetical protein
MSFTSFGYEQENGSIFYINTVYMTIEEVHKFLLLKTIPTHDGKFKTSPSITEYYNDSDSNLMIVYMLDGSAQIKRNGFSGVFVFFN